MSCSTTKPTKWHVGPAKTQINLGICPVWSESLLCTQWVDQTGAQADVSPCWVHMSFYWFCHAVAQIIKSDIQYVKNYEKRKWLLCCNLHKFMLTLKSYCQINQYPFLCSFWFQKAHKRGLSVKKTKRKRDYTSMKSIGVKSIDETFKVCTVMILSFRTPKTFVVITLKFELCGFTID